MAAGGGTRAIVAAAIANGGIAIAKFVAFLVTGASSMLAESIHSVADTSNQGLLILGTKRAKREFSAEHAFGYSRERYFWSFVVALVLFSAGGMFALYEGWHKLEDPHEITSPAWAIGVLVFGIGLEGWSFRTAIVEANPLRKGRSWMTFIRRSRTPELPVVLLEDLGAMVGLVLALVGVTLAITVDPIWDALGSIAIGLLLTVIAIILAIEMRSLLLGESAVPDDIDALRDVVRDHDDVAELLHLRTQHLGPDDLLVAGKVRMRSGLGFERVSEVIDECEARMRERVPSARMIYLEPGTELAAHERRDAGAR